MATFPDAAHLCLWRLGDIGVGDEDSLCGVRVSVNPMMWLQAYGLTDAASPDDRQGLAGVTTPKLTSTKTGRSNVSIYASRNSMGSGKFRAGRCRWSGIIALSILRACFDILKAASGACLGRLRFEDWIPKPAHVQNELRRIASVSFGRSGDGRRRIAGWSVSDRPKAQRNRRRNAQPQEQKPRRERRSRRACRRRRRSDSSSGRRILQSGERSAQRIRHWESGRIAR